MWEKKEVGVKGIKLKGENSLHDEEFVMENNRGIYKQRKVPVGLLRTLNILPSVKWTEGVIESSSHWAKGVL